jgi:hypothetical protein
MSTKQRQKNWAQERLNDSIFQLSAVNSRLDSVSRNSDALSELFLVAKRSSGKQPLAVSGKSVKKGPPRKNK